MTVPNAADRRRPSRVIIATAVAVGLLATALWLATSTGGGSDRPHRPLPLRPSTLDGLSTTIPANTIRLVWPADVWWMEVAGFHLPASAQAGPRRESAGQVWGFGHDPVGAVFAALHLIVRTSPQVGPAVFAPTLREQVVGPDAAAYAAAVAASYDSGRRSLGLPYGQPLDPITATVPSVRVQAYTPQACDLLLLVEAADGARAVTLVQLSWTGSDWRLVAPPLGDWAAVRSPATAETAAGFTPLPAR